MINPSDPNESNAADQPQQSTSRGGRTSNQMRGMSNKFANSGGNSSGHSSGQSGQSSNKRNNLALDPHLMEQLLGSGNKKLKTNHQQQLGQQQQQQQQQLNPQYQLLQAQIQVQLAQIQQQQQANQQMQQLQLQQQLNKSLSGQRSSEFANNSKSNNLAQLAQLSQLGLAGMSNQQLQQLMNLKKNEQLQSNNKQQLLNHQAALAAAIVKGEMPLDLCVNKAGAKPTSNDLAAIANQIRQNQLLNSLTNNTGAGDLMSQQLDNEQLEALLKQKQRGGRKPKSSTQTSEQSLITPSPSSANSSFNQQKQSASTSTANFDLLNNSARDSPVHAGSSLIDKQQPKKRGRPPAATATGPQSMNNQQQQQNNQNNLTQILGLIQSNPELLRSPAGKTVVMQVLASLSQQQQQNRNNNGAGPQDLLFAQLQANITNQMKAMQAQSAVGNRQMAGIANSSSAKASKMSTSKVVVEEMKRGDPLDSEESDIDSESSNNRDQITFTKNYDERSLRVPLACGWRRQTLIRTISKSGVRGEVFYISPCGKKFKNFSEVDKYLMKSNKHNLRKEHFNFSPRIVIGEFIEQQPSENNKHLIDYRLSEEAVIGRIESIRRSMLKKPGSGASMINNNKATMNSQTANNLKKSAAIAREQALIDAEMEKNRQLAEAKLREELLRQKQAKEEEVKRQLELQREQEAKRKKELALLAEVDRERKKQHQILVKTIETNRRVLDREKKMASFSNERRLQQDRRHLKKRIESEIQKEIKKPVEDMMLKDLDNLQTLNRIPGLKLSGKAFADLLMIYEFLHNFYECINLDKDRIPTLNTLQSGLLNLDDASECELMDILQHLLTIAMDDPGIPYNPSTLNGQKLKDIQLNSLNMTEVLKLYFQSYVGQIREDSVSERVEFRLYNLLDSGKPFLALNASVKVEILAYICNELLCNQSIIKKIEDRIESASNIKRDKWVVENDLRKYKLLKVKREKREDELAEERARNEEKKKESNEHEDNSDSDHDSQVYGNEIEGEEQLTNAEIDKNIEKLTKSVNNQSNKLNKIINSYRVTSFGQDRYRRRYWCLPNAGAVFVESMESCEIEENLKLLEEEEQENEEDEELADDESDEKMEIVNGLEKSTKGEAKAVEKKQLPPPPPPPVSSRRSSKSRRGVKEEPVKEEPVDVKPEPEVKTEEVKEEEKVKEENSGVKMEVDDKDKENEGQPEEEGAQKAEEPVSEMPNYEDLLNSEWILSIINNVYANYPQQSSGLPGTLKKTVLPGLEFLATQQQQQSRQVFNILPRTSCSLNVPSELPDLKSPAPADAAADESTATVTTSKATEQQQPDKQDLSLYKINDVTILPQELDIDANLQSQLIDLKKLEYSRPKKIAEEYRYGWWRITDTAQLRQVAESMHERANRERNLKKHILKYFNNLAAKIRQNNVEFDITDLDRIISQKCPYGAPVHQSDEEWSESTALRLDIMVLELVEGLEETIASSSMQIRGWKPMLRTEFEKEFTCYPLYKVPKPDDLDLDDESVCSTNAAEENGEQAAHPPKINNPILIARERLLAAEAGIERRYLKPPLGFKNNTILLTSGNDEYADNANDENATSGLIRWREAVRVCESGTQLALLLHFLESCIAWDKSIMRACCQFCNSGENEAELLLCDDCDRGKLFGWF